MLNPGSSLASLLAAPLRPGVVTWIGVRPDRRVSPVPVLAVMLDPATGLAGDHYASRTGRTRQVTLIGAADLAAIASYLGLDQVDPTLLRRNIVVAGINLHALRGRHFQAGAAVLEATGECHPCSRMEEAFGTGGYNAVRGHGGITARILSRGELRLGDAVSRIEPSSAD